jgi:LuxR family maltose regulon positive regulatory protein
MIVNTKLHIPHVRHSIVARLRLIDKLSEGMEAKLTLVSAQAGYGKTTTLSQWARQCGRLVAWVSLDKHDNDWIHFWSYIMASIRENVSGFGAQVEPYLEKGPSEYIIKLTPVILRRGKSLFYHVMKHKQKLIESKVFRSGVVILHYNTKENRKVSHPFQT